MLHSDMKLRWVLTSIIVSFPAEQKALPTMPGVKTGNNQQATHSFNCIGLHCNIGIRGRAITTSTPPPTTTPNSQSKMPKASVIQTFLKLLTRGLLKKIALPAILRMASKGEQSGTEKRYKNWPGFNDRCPYVLFWEINSLLEKHLKSWQKNLVCKGFDKCILW